MPLLSSCPAKGSLFFFKPQRNSSGQTWLRQVKFEERIVEHPQIHQVATRLIPTVAVLFLARGPLDMLRYKMTKGLLGVLVPFMGQEPAALVALPPILTMP